MPSFRLFKILHFEKIRKSLLTLDIFCFLLEKNKKPKINVSFAQKIKIKKAFGKLKVDMAIINLITLFSDIWLVLLLWFKITK